MAITLVPLVQFSPKIENYDPLQNWDLSIPSERAPSKLSENLYLDY